MGRESSSSLGNQLITTLMFVHYAPSVEHVPNDWSGLFERYEILNKPRARTYLTRELVGHVAIILPKIPDQGEAPTKSASAGKV